jgi:hypothetical protein
MKAFPPNDSEPDMGWDENDPVWRLLAQAPRPAPDAWFAMRTLSRCRREGLGEERRTTALNWLPRVAGMWRLALGGGLALSMAAALLVTQIQSQSADKQKNVQEAFEIMASIDNSSDTSSSSSWQDSSL